MLITLGEGDKAPTIMFFDLVISTATTTRAIRHVEGQGSKVPSIITLCRVLREFYEYGRGTYFDFYCIYAQ